MDAAAFDRLSRRLGRPLTRRALGAAIVGAAASLAGLAEIQAAPRCPKGKKRCKQRCIPKRHCCTTAQCGRKLRGSVCKRGRCVCPASKQRCGAACIAAAACCQDGDCGAGGACVGGACQCAAGFEPCHGRCIPAGSTCCPPTAAALRAELGAGGPDTIQLCPNTTYQGTFSINRNVTVIGVGAGSTILDGGGGGPVVTVASSVTAAELRGVRIRNGLVGVNDEGAGILNLGTLTLTECAVTNNRSLWAAGGVYSSGVLTLNGCTVASNRAEFSGGGLSNAGGVLTITASTITNNQSSGIYSSSGTVTLTDTTVSENDGFDGGGIGVDSNCTLSLTRCTVTGNYASGNGGGGIANWGGTVTLTESTVIGNQADTDGGGIFHESHFGSDAEMTLNDTQVSGNQAVGRGGGIFSRSWDDWYPCSLLLRGDTTVTNNDADATSAESGGGIYREGGTIEFFDTSSVSGNRPNDCTGATCPA